MNSTRELAEPSEERAFKEWWYSHGGRNRPVKELARAAWDAHRALTETRGEAPSRGASLSTTDFGKLIPGDMRQVDGQWFVRLETGKWGAGASPMVEVPGEKS